MDKGFGLISTEDMLAGYDHNNQKITSGEIDSETERMLLGCDAVALFPSLQPTKCAKIVGDELISSDLKIEDVDYQVLAKYVAMSWNVGQIRCRDLHRIIPTRRSKFGPRPGVKSQEAKEPGDRIEEHSQWIFNKKELSDHEKRQILGAAVEIAISASFKLHIYSFGGQVYKQLSGGPIGSRLTMAVSKVIMLVWGRRVHDALIGAGITIYTEGCYVDDIRLLISLLSPNLYWNKIRKCWTTKEELEDDENSEIKTGTEVRWNMVKNCWEKSDKIIVKAGRRLFKEQQPPEEQKLVQLDPIPANLDQVTGVTPGEDTRSREEKEEHTKNEILNMMNGIFSFLKFTAESGSDFPEEDFYLPSLDTKLKLMEDNKINYRFYEKKMGSQYCVQKTAAMAE